MLFHLNEINTCIDTPQSLYEKILDMYLYHYMFLWYYKKKKLKTVKKKNMEQPSDLNDITVPVRICKLVDKCYNSNSVNVIKTVMNIANMSSNGTK